MQRAKYYCQPCDKVVKSVQRARCPQCGQDMTPMGTTWRPGRQGSRTRMWDRRQEKPVPLFWWDANRPWWLGSPYVSPLRPRPRIGRKRRRAVVEAQREFIPRWRRR